MITCKICHKQSKPASNYLNQFESTPNINTEHTCITCYQAILASTKRQEYSLLKQTKHQLDEFKKQQLETYTKYKSLTDSYNEQDYLYHRINLMLEQEKTQQKKKAQSKSTKSKQSYTKKEQNIVKEILANMSEEQRKAILAKFTKA